MRKSAVNIFSIVAGSLVIVTGLAIALNWTYLRRVVTHPEEMITQADWYKPLAKVQGNFSDLPRAHNSHTIPADSIAKISTYAQKHNSAALLVLHRGKLVSESYWQDFESSSTFNCP